MIILTLQALGFLGLSKVGGTDPISSPPPPPQTKIFNNNSAVSKLGSNVELP